jgi:hypothetical protein
LLADLVLDPVLLLDGVANLLAKSLVKPHKVLTGVPRVEIECLVQRFRERIGELIGFDDRNIRSIVVPIRIRVGFVA